MGRHIIFEGPDGSGKSTAIAATQDWLEETGRKVWVTNSPSYYPVGAIARSYFTKAETLFPDDETRAAFIGALFSADMLEHDVEIRRKLTEEEGDDIFVLQSRSWISTYCYQAKCKGIQRFLLDEVRPRVHAPDAVIFLSADLDLCMERVRSRDKAIVDMFEKKATLQQVMDQWNFLGKYLTNTHVLSCDTTEATPEETLGRIQDFFSGWGLVHGD